MNQNLEDWEAQKEALAALSQLPDAPETTAEDEMDLVQPGAQRATENFDLVEPAASYSADDPAAKAEFAARQAVTFSGPKQEQLPSLIKQPTGGFNLGRALTAFGGGDVGAYDAHHAAMDNAPYVDEQRRLTRQDQADARGDKQLARSSARARLDPKSPESKQAQQEYVGDLLSIAEAPGLPVAYAEQLRAFAKNAPTMSASRIDAARPAIIQRTNLILKGAGVAAQERLGEKNADVRERGVAAQEAMVPVKAADMSEGRQIQRDALAEAKRHHIEDKPPLKVKLPGENTLKDFRQRQVIINQTKEALSLLPKVRYSGAGAESANALMSKVPGALDIRNDAERKVAGIVNTLRAAARNKLFGAALSKYDIQDANSFLANLGNNPETFKANLEIALKALQDMNDMTIEQYPSISGDEIPGASKSANPNVDRAKAILTDPKESPEKKAKAEKWLQANGQ